MKFMDKIKNIFTEEVEEVTPIKKEVVQVEIPSPVVNEPEKKPVEIEVPPIQDEIPVKKQTLFFDEEDFKPEIEEILFEEPIKPTYQPRLYKQEVKQEKQDKKEFKPTPIISPIYGMLDKNYVKEDIVEKRHDDLESPIDTVRKKAYGTLEDELESTLFGNTSIFLKDDEELEIKPKQDKVQKAEELIEAIDQLEKTIELEQDLFELIDSMYEGGE
ncbi:MAG: hypothetical protein R3Y21_05295 [Mycoplasmatota bacterium]